MAKAAAKAKARDDAAPGPNEQCGAAALSAAPVAAALGALAAAWIAAGSTGLLGHGLRHALTWVALAVALLADWRGQAWSPLRLWALVAAGAAALAMTASHLPAVNVLGAVVLVCGLAAGRAGRGQRVLLAAAAAVTVFAVYRVAYTSIATVWFLADRLGELLGRLGGHLAGRPLWVGATFAGVDFLVLTAALYVLCVAGSSRPRWKCAVVGALGVVAGHAAYLAAVALAADAMAALPQADPRQGWSWLGVLHAALPWNLPALAGAIHLAVAGGLLAWTPWAQAAPASQAAPEALAARPAAAPCPRWVRPAQWLAAILLAAALPASALLPLARGSLTGRKVVAYQRGYLNWLRPKHGEYGRVLSVGMYGMMGRYVRALGGRFSVSPDLSERDLQDADVLILLYPDEEWQPGQLGRIHEFVRRGGSLLVMGEHTIWGKGPRDPAHDAAELAMANEDGNTPSTQGAAPTSRGEDGNTPSTQATVRAMPDKDDNSAFNEALQPTGMQVRFDSATFAVGGWLHSYEAIAHPATAGIGDDRNEFGVVIGASVAVRWPARPLLVGKWGWADSGDEGNPPSMMGNHRYDGGEKLGDLVLVAEQPFGKGKVVAFGDTSSMTNGITVGAHAFTSRLLGYLASPGNVGQAMWRQAAGAALAVLLLLLLVRAACPLRLAVASLVLGGSLVACTSAAWRLAEVLPDGRGRSPNNLAYVDTAHMGGFSDESWRPEGNGLGGLELTLMRNGYLALTLPEFTRRRIERAGLVISVAPQREFTPAERKWVGEFVEGGGIFIVTAGHDLGGASRSLLADFGCQIGDVVAGPEARVSEPQPMGHFKSLYPDTGKYRVYVRFHAAWPVACEAKDAQPVAYGRGERPVIVLRRIGLGAFVVIGDPLFPVNRNLENEGGEPFEGLYENADFWRWFLTVLRGQEEWVPPREVTTAPTTTAPAATAPAAPPPTATASAAGAPATAPAESRPALDTVPRRQGPADGEEVPR